MNHWLVKSEPSAYSWDDLVKDKKTAWTGVRNFQARIHLRSMRRGDRVFFYHSVVGKCVVGEAEITKEAFPDATATEGEWVCVEIRPLKPLAHPVSLEQIKGDPRLSGIALIRQSRLSVMPLSPAEYRAVLDLGKKPAA